MSKVPAVMIVIGGSHRQYAKDKLALGNANIPFKWLGPLSLNSKKVLVVIPQEHLEKARELGMSKSREQWEWIKSEGCEFEEVQK